MGLTWKETPIPVSTEHFSEPEGTRAATESTLHNVAERIENVVEEIVETEEDLEDPVFTSTISGTKLEMTVTINALPVKVRPGPIGSPVAFFDTLPNFVVKAKKATQ